MHFRSFGGSNGTLMNHRKGKAVLWSDGDVENQRLDHVIPILSMQTENNRRIAVGQYEEWQEDRGDLSRLQI